MVYLHASLKLHSGKLQDFTALLNTLLPILGKHGWKLLGSYACLAGRLNTAVDLWELPDPNALQAVFSDPEFATFGPQISEIVEDETLTMLTKLPVG